MSEDASVGLIRTLVENMKQAPENWQSFAFVLTFNTEEVSGVFGFAYAPDGASTSVTASPWDIRDGVKAYTDAVYEPGAALPAALLVQFDRSSGNYEVTFEDADAARWKATPANFDTIDEELRPDFA